MKNEMSIISLVGKKLKRLESAPCVFVLTFILTFIICILTTNSFYKSFFGAAILCGLSILIVMFYNQSLPSSKIKLNILRARTVGYTFGSPMRAVSSMSVIVFLISFSIFYFFPIVLRIGSENGIWNSTAFGVTSAAFVVAIMIFRIQTYPELFYTLHIHAQHLNSPSSRAITMIVTYTNRSTSPFKGSLIIKFPEIVLSKGVFYQRGNENFHQEISLMKKGDVYEMMYEPINSASNSIHQNSSSYLLPALQIETVPKSFLIRAIFGNRAMGFHPDQVQDTIDQVLTEASNGNTRGRVLEA